MISQAKAGSCQEQKTDGAPGRGLWDGFGWLEIRPRASKGNRLAVCLLIVAVTLGWPRGGKAGLGLCPGDGNIRGTVTSVNERLELTLEGGLLLKIAGIDPPRPTPNDPDLDVHARDRLAQWLTGQEIRYLPLETGVDRWGRTVAFVFAPSSPAQAKDQEKGQEEPSLAVGAALIDAGLARYEPSVAARPCQGALLAAEAGARTAGLGVWADPYYAVIAATDRPSFADKVGTAVIVEGRVAGIADRRPRIVLYFGRQGWDFSVAIVPRGSKSFAASRTAAAGLTGHLIRVRGLLNTRFGPQIEISSPDEIEVMGEVHDPQTAPPAPGTPAAR